MMRRLMLLTKFSGEDKKEDEQGTRKECDCMKFNMLLDSV